MSDVTANGPTGDSSGREVKKVTRFGYYIIVLLLTTCSLECIL